MIASPSTTTSGSGGLSRSVKALSKPLGGLIAVGLGVAGFAAPAMHGLGTPFSTALIVAGLGAYGLAVGAVGSPPASGTTTTTS